MAGGYNGNINNHGNTDNNYFYEPLGYSMLMSNSDVRQIPASFIQNFICHIIQRQQFNPELCNNNSVK